MQDDKVILDADCQLPDGRRLRAGQRVPRHVAEQAQALKLAPLAVAVHVEAKSSGRKRPAQPAAETADSAS